MSDACAFWHVLQEWEEDLDQPRTVEHLVSARFHWFFCSPVFTFGRCETPQVDENEGRLVDTFGTSAAKKPFRLEKIERNPQWIFEYVY